MDLFTAKEREIVLATETARLEELDEDGLADLVVLVRRMRNKYRDLHRTQVRSSQKAAGKRAASATTAERTLRKAEILEDSLSRVARHLSRAARQSAKELKAERIAAARAVRSGATEKASRATRGSAMPGGTKAKGARSKVTGGRVGRTSAATKRSQAAKDNR